MILTLPDGRRLTVMLIELRGDKCRIGFDAPPDIAVHRSEVQAAIDREKAAEPKGAAGVLKSWLPEG